MKSRLLSKYYNDYFSFTSYYIFFFMNTSYSKDHSRNYEMIILTKLVTIENPNNISRIHNIIKSLLQYLVHCKPIYIT